MKPEDKKVEIVDGTHPASGGKMTVEHGDGDIELTIAGDENIVQKEEGGLKPFNEHIIEDIEKANGGEDTTEAETEIIKPTVVNPGAPPSPGPEISNQIEPVQQPQPMYATAPLTVNKNRLDESPSPNNGAYSTNPNYVSQQFNQPVANNNDQLPTMNIHPTKSVIGTPDNFNNGVPIAPGNPGIQNINTIRPKKSKKKLLILFIPLILILLAGIYVFAFYLPNTPENVWKTGLNRSGKQVDALIETLTNPEQLETYEKTKLSISGEIEQGDQKFALDVNSQLSNDKSTTTLGVKTDIDNQENIDITADVLTDLPEGANYPNIYFKINGISQLGLDIYLPGIADYDNKWVSIEQDFLERLEGDLVDVAEDEAEQQVTYDDYMTIVKDVNAVAQEYLFTTDPNFAVLNLSEFVGTEESEGIKANHYKVNFNKQNYANFCTALINKLFENQTVKKLEAVEDENIDDQAKTLSEECQKAAEEIDEEDVFDIWFDKKYKLFHKIRIYEDIIEDPGVVNLSRYADCINSNNGKEEPCQYLLGGGVDEENTIGEAYSELGQVYKGGDDFMLFVNYKKETKEELGTARFELNINVKTLAFNGSIVISDKKDGDEVKTTINMASEPFEGEIDSSKPEGAVTIEKMIKDVFGYTLPPKTVKTSVKDGERKSDIGILQTTLEEYYIANQTYPSFKQINDNEFRTGSMKSVKEENYADPAGATDRLADRVDANVYAYVVVPANCDGQNLECNYYELSAKLDNGQLYTKKALQ